jgi:hypothetical protein
MLGRSIGLCFVVALLVASQAGCKKSPSQESPDKQGTSQRTASATAELQTALRIHWLGMKRLGAESNAASFVKVWNMPESQKLEAQTLDKLAGAPWRPSPQGTNAAEISVTNSASHLLRPLLDDLVQEECYLEVSGLSNRLGGMALAIRLDDQRSSLWKTNFAAVVESFTEAHALASLLTNSSTFERVQDWTLVGFGPEQRPLLTKFADAIHANGIPFATRITNFWVEADADLSRLGHAIPVIAPLISNLAKVNLTVIGQGPSVRTEAHLKFDRPLVLNLEPWNLPTNLIHEPLTSFTALRGARPWLATLGPFKDVPVENLPNQLFAWAEGTSPMLYFCAAPVPDASNKVYQTTEYLLHEGNAWMATNGFGKFRRPKDSNSVVWDTVPFLDPHLEAAHSSDTDFALLRFGPSTYTNRPPPPGLFEQFVGVTNVLAYDWELSGPRLESWLYFAQFFRFVLRKTQVPPESVSIAWFNAIEPNLSNCGSEVIQSAPDELLFLRNSTIGLSSLELQLLADWFESPNFPYGLTTFAPSRPPAIPKRKLPPGLSPVPPALKTNGTASPHP